MVREMLVLAVDTSTPFGSLAVFRGSQLVGSLSMLSTEGFSTRLFRYVDFLSAELGFEMAEVDLYAVNAGPGSFTGLRVGLTAAKGWAEVYGKPIAPVSGLEAVAAEFSGGEGCVIPLLDARRGQIFAGVYQANNSHLERQGAEFVLSPAEVLIFLAGQKFSAPPTFVTPHPDVVRAALADSQFSSCILHVVSPILAPRIGQLGMAMERAGRCVDALRLEANYIRRSDAELHGPKK
jgi:tRNA threonylcarbamoyladenosine biosynthesis protein TsaB